MEKIKDFINLIINFLVNLFKKSEIADIDKPIPKTKYNKKIIIDPGHGLYFSFGNYKYQRDFFDNIVEDEITVKTAIVLGNLLKKHDIEVIYTRNVFSNRIGVSGFIQSLEGAYEYFKYLTHEEKPIIPNHFIPLGSKNNTLTKDINARNLFVNKIHSDSDLLISIHFNASPSPNTGKGAETLYQKNNEIGKQIAKNIQFHTVEDTKVYDRGIKENNSLSILTRPQITSIVWEGAFFDNDYDRNKFLKDEDYYEKAGTAIYKGIIQSIEEKLI